MGQAHQDRAKQFSPYAALRGLDEIVAKKRELTDEKRELSEEECAVISKRLSELERGMAVSLKYYRKDRYIPFKGTVEAIDKVFKNMRLGGVTVSFADISEIEIIRASDQ